MIDLLALAEDASLKDADAIAELRREFGRMMAGPVGDFFVWRDDFDERVAANAEYEAAVRAIRALLAE